MTVLLGRQPETPEPGYARASSPGVRTDEPWDERRRRCRLARQQQGYPTWQPAPNAPRHRPPDDPGPEAGTPSSGMLDLYAGRARRQPESSAAPRRARANERTFVCSWEDGARPHRAYAVIPQPRRIGRGSEEHYLTLHPRTPPVYGRLRGGGIEHPRQIVLRRKADIHASGSRLHRGVQSVLYPLITGSMAAPMQGTRRILIATVAALIVLASAATSGFAGQQRYEVHDGDTIESVAATFGVDPASIRSSSYLPTGDDLQDGQVIVIPEPGQAPEAAARMAAANEGGSPWVATAHVIEAGETAGSIAAI